MFVIAAAVAIANESPDLRSKPEAVFAQALVVGAIRANVITAFDVTEPGLMRDELLTTRVPFRAATATEAATAEWPAAWTAGEMTANPVKKVFDWTVAHEWSDDEVSLATWLGVMAPAIPVIQGASIIATGHHCIPPTYPNFLRVEKAVWSSAPSKVGDVLRGRAGLPEDVWIDLAYHKACHPISMGDKQMWAASLEIANRLDAAGLGAATIILPAVPTSANSLRAGIAVIYKARPTLQRAGMTIITIEAEQLNERMEAATTKAERAVVQKDVDKWVAKAKPVIALAAGVVRQQNERAGTSEDSTLRAFSVSRIVNENPGSHAEGRNIASGVADRLRKSIEEGHLLGVAYEL